jgi:ferrous iron transport protein B
MSCGAKFPVYILLIGSLFAKRYSSLLIFTIYVIGILIGIITAKLMKKYVFKGPTTPFVMELPPYRVPTFRGVYHQMWEKLWSYLKKAGTILLAVSIVFWFLLNYPKLNDSEKAVFKTKIDSINYEFNKQISTIAQKVKKSYFDKQNSVSSEAELTDNQKILFKSILFKQTFEKLNKIYKNFNDKILKERTDDHNVRYNTLISERDKLIKEIENKSEEIFLIANQYRILLEYKKVRIKEIESEKISYEKNKSYAGRIGNFITPVFKPMGLDDWRISLSLIAGLAAKEVVVATLGVVYGVEEEEDEETLSLRRKIQEDPFFQRKSPVKSSLVVKRGDKYFLKADNETPVTQRDGAFYLPDSLKAFVLMIFVLLYVPCLATIAIFIKEGGGKLTILMISYNLVIAYTVCTIIYQFGRLFGL